MKEYNKRNRNNELKTEDTLYKRRMTRRSTVKNTKEGSGRQMKQNDFNGAMEISDQID